MTDTPRTVADELLEDDEGDHYMFQDYEQEAEDSRTVADVIAELAERLHADPETIARRLAMGERAENTTEAHGTERSEAWNDGWNAHRRHVRGAASDH